MTKKEDISEAERELLLEQHKELQKSIRLQIRQNAQRLLSGIAGVGAVTGASLLRESEWLLALIPFIFAIVFIRTVDKHRYIALNAIHSIRIEKKLKKIEPLFDRERRYGGFFGEEVPFKESPHRWISLHNILNYGTIPILIPIYFLTLSIGLRLWNSRPDELMFVSNSVLFAIYIVLTIYIAIVGGVGWFYVRKLRGDIDTER